MVSTSPPDPPGLLALQEEADAALEKTKQANKKKFVKYQQESEAQLDAAKQQRADEREAFEIKQRREAKKEEKVRKKLKRSVSVALEEMDEGRPSTNREKTGKPKPGGKG